jgi:hypothetical protein
MWTDSTGGGHKNSTFESALCKPRIFIVLQYIFLDYFCGHNPTQKGWIRCAQMMVELVPNFRFVNVVRSLFIRIIRVFIGANVDDRDQYSPFLCALVVVI